MVGTGTIVNPLRGRKHFWFYRGFERVYRTRIVLIGTFIIMRQTLALNRNNNMRISGLSGHRIYCDLNAMIYANGSGCELVIGGHRSRD